MIWRQRCCTFVMLGLDPTGFTDRGNEFRLSYSISSWPGLSGPPIAARCGGGGPDKPYRIHRSRKRFSRVLLYNVMARLVRATGTSTGALGSGPDKPYRIHRSRKRIGSVVLNIVMARLVRATYRGTVRWGWPGQAGP